jgi:hypothetical protein
VFLFDLGFVLWQVGIMKNMKRLVEVMQQIDPNGEIRKLSNGVIRIHWSAGGASRTFISKNFENSASLALNWLEPLLKGLSK